MIECFLNLPELQQMANPITIINIHNHQQADLNLQLSLQTDPQHYMTQGINGTDVIVFHYPNRPWKIIIPESLIEDVILWYHRVLGHCGQQRLYDTIASRFYITKLQEKIQVFKCADNCMQYKQPGRSYGKLPARTARLVPWDEVAVDLVGPWEIEIHGEYIEFKALTCIDTVTNLAEIIRINNKTSQHISDQFQNCWLARYPSPNRCVHDNGGEFLGHEFQQLLAQAGITSVPTTVKNPQANAICERLHRTMGDVLRVILRTDTPDNELEAEQIVDNALATCMHVTRCSINHQMRTSPGALVFNRDMFLDIPLLANLEAIRNRRQQLIDQNLIRLNRIRIDYNYTIGDQVMVKTYDPTKLQERFHGPYNIVRVYTNGTVRLQRNPTTTEVFNIRKLTPYRGVEEANIVNL